MYAFVHIEKTGGVTLNEALRRSFGIFHCDAEPWRGYTAMPFDADDYRRLRWIQPGLRSIAGHCVTPWGGLESVRPDVRYYTILREPIARTASHYQYHVHLMGQQRTFEQWMELPHQRNVQCTRIAGEPSADAAIEMIQRKDIFVGLLEAYDECLRMLRHWMDDELQLVYEARNAAPSQDIARTLRDDPASRARLEDANREDLRLYEWVKADWMPRQRERFDRPEEPATSPPGALSDLRLALARLHRNLIYKPLLGLARRNAG